MMEREPQMMFYCVSVEDCRYHVRICSCTLTSNMYFCDSHWSMLPFCVEVM